MPLIKVRHCHKTNTDISLFYETFGNPQNHPIFLIAGLNCQMLYWPTQFCEILARKYNCYVIRFDNRDIGLSTKLDHSGQEGLCSLLCCSNCCVSPIYTLDDMALDVLALAEKLLLVSNSENSEPQDVSSDNKPKREFTLCGISMGGAITQCAAAIAQSPAWQEQTGNRLKLKSVTLMFTFPGDPKHDERPSLSVLAALTKTPKDKTREAFIENLMNMSRVCFVPKSEWMKKENGVMEKFVETKSSSTKPIIEKSESTLDQIFRDTFGSIFDRVPNEAAASRQFSAISRQQSRVDICKKYLGARNGLPTLILHGAKDEVVKVSQGRYLHKLVPDATYIEFGEIGHAFLPRVSHYIAYRIVKNIFGNIDEEDEAVPEDAKIFEVKNETNRNSYSACEPTAAVKIDVKLNEQDDKESSRLLELS